MRNEAKQKALELFDKMLTNQRMGLKIDNSRISNELSKDCAIICVDEIIFALSIAIAQITVPKEECADTREELEFWYKVKQELNKL